MSEVLAPVDVATLGAGWATGLDLNGSGDIGQPLVVVDLTRPASAESVEAAVAVAADALPILVGFADGPIDPSCRRLPTALSMTVTSQESVVGEEYVLVPDVGDELSRLATAITAKPRASVVVGQVLRQAAVLPTRQALAAEASAYSTLLAGPEFAEWLGSRGARREPSHSAAPAIVSRSATELTIVLNRPERRNAIDAVMRDALVDALSLAVADSALTVTLSGRGPAFCSGGDLDEFGTTKDIGAAYLVRLERHPGWLLHQLRARSLARVHGACIGAGIEIPAFAGRLEADASAYFCLPEIAMGLIAGAGGTSSITRRIGRWRTAWLALTGERINVTRALEWGLIDAVKAG